MSSRQRLAILISGRGSNMRAIVSRVESGELNADVVLVVADSQEAEGLVFAKERSIPVACIPSRGRTREDFERELSEALALFKPDWIVLAGFMRILTPNFVNQFRGKIVNIHPADSRVYQGRYGYEWAWEQRLPSTLITVHLVDDGVDTGEVIAQRAVNLHGASSIEEVKARGLAVEHVFYSEVLRQLCIDAVGGR